MKRLLFCIALSFFITHLSRAQQLLPDIEQILEQYDIVDSQDDYEEIVSNLVFLYTNPLNLNTTTFDSLKLLPFLSDSQIDNILRFRKTYGGFRHPNELLLIPGIGRSTWENIFHFVYIADFSISKRRQAIRKTMRHELVSRLRTSFPRQAGYRWYTPDAFLKESDYQKHCENRFLGPPWGVLIKYKLSASPWLQAGISLENDAGESYFTRYQKGGFDFVSGHLSINTSTIVEQIILGDYKLQAGQGMIAWHGFSSGKSTATLSNEKSGKGATPYTSTDENNFLRGLAIQLKASPHLKATLFVSGKKSDGNIIDRDSLDPDDLESASLDQSGYHRTLTEARKKRTIKEFTAGGFFNYNHRSFRIGFNSIYYNFKPPLRVGEHSYQQYNDDGSHRFLASIDYKTGFHNFYFFGETAFSDNGSIGTVNGLRYSGLSKISLSLLFRRYDKKFTSFYNSGFGEYSNTSNEEGVYVGIESTPIRKLKINAYFDWFRFFSPRYRATIPGRGYELLGNFLFTPKNSEWNLRIKHESKPEDIKTGQLESVQRIRQDCRLQYSWKKIKTLELRSRLDYSRYIKKDIKESGFMICQEFIHTMRKPEIKTQFRIAFFQTDSYNTRIYAYEHNVLYGYSFPAYYDKGIRTYLNLNWKPTKTLTCYMKAGFTHYTDREYISSGLTRVEGNRLFDLTFQLRLKL